MHDFDTTENISNDIDAIIDENDGWNNYLESLEGWTTPAFDGTLKTSFVEATRMRDSYRHWIIRKLDSVAEERGKLTEAIGLTDDGDTLAGLISDLEFFDMMNDTSFLEQELERLQVADDQSSASGTPGHRFVRVEEARSRAHAMLIRDALEALEDGNAFVVKTTENPKAELKADAIIAVKGRTSLSHTLPARIDLSELEFGISEDLPRWFDQGWTVPRRDENGRPNPERVSMATESADECINALSTSDLEFYLETAPSLCWMDEVVFERLEGEDMAAVSKRASIFIRNVMTRWLEKGDHDMEVLWQPCTWTFDDADRAQGFINKVKTYKRGRFHGSRVITNPDGTQTFEADVTWPLQQMPNGFKVVTLRADGNWGSWDNYGHRRMRSFARDRYVQDLLDRVSGADSTNELNAIRREAGRASRDNQVLTFDRQARRPAHTHDGGSVIRVVDKDGKVTYRHTGRKVGIGLNFERYAAVMNAVASRAEELGLKGFERRYNVDTYDTTERDKKDGDMLDVGCAVGEFVALEMPADLDTHQTLWNMMEGAWQPSTACMHRMRAAGPTGFVWRSWTEILADANDGFSMTSCGSLGMALAA